MKTISVEQKMTAMAKMFAVLLDDTSTRDERIAVIKDALACDYITRDEAIHLTVEYV